MRPIRVTVIGLSLDLGLLGKTHFNPKHSVKFWLLLLQLVLAILLWTLSMTVLSLAFFWPPRVRRQHKREMSHRIFGFLRSRENFYEHKNGLLSRIERLCQRSTEVTQLSRIGQSLREACKRKEQIPLDQDLFFLHLGSMDYLNHLSITKFRHNLRELYQEISRKSPDAHVVMIGPPDLVAMLSTPLNSTKVLPLPGAPTVADLHRWEGFSKRLGTRSGADAATLTYARRLLDVYVKVMQHELRRARKIGILKSFSFIDSRVIPMYRDEDRSLYFAWDGVHLSSEGVGLTVEYSWPALARDLAQFTHLTCIASAEKDRPAAARIIQEFPAAQFGDVAPNEMLLLKG